MNRIGALIVGVAGSWMVLGGHLLFSTAAYANVCRWQVDGKWTLYQRNGFRLPMNLRQSGDFANGSTYGDAVLGSGNVRSLMDGKHFTMTINWQNGQQGYYEGNVEVQWNGSQQTFVLKGWMYDLSQPWNRVDWWKGTLMYYRCTPT